MRADTQTPLARTYWWDREPPTRATALRAVIFDADSAFSDPTGLVDSVMSLFCSGVWVAVVSTRRREQVRTLVRHTVGDGLVETVVTVDDLIDATRSPVAELYRLALWELGIGPREALAVTGSRRGRRAARALALPTCGTEPLLTSGYRRAHRL